MATIVSETYGFDKPSPRDYCSSKTWTRSSKGWAKLRPKPINEYSRYVVTAKNGEGVTVVDAANSHLAYYFREKEYIAINLALEDLDSKIGSSASLGETIGEGREAFAMIASRAGQLSQSITSLRRGDLASFARNLLVPPNEQHLRQSARSIARNAGSLWLEYWLGWSPLISDIQNATRVLVGDIPVSRLRAKGRYKWSHSDRNRYFGYTLIRKWSVISTCTISTDVRVGDANVALANRLGFRSPLSIAWALVPMSFLVDWVTNIGDILDSYNMFAGYEFSNSSYTVKSVSRDGYIWELFDDGYREGTREIKRDLNPVSAFSLNRRFGIPGYTRELEISPPYLPATRAATAISLLSQGFKDLIRYHR